MLQIRLQDWDSNVLGIRVGAIEYPFSVERIRCDVADEFEMLVARIPQAATSSIGEIEALGFRYVCNDLKLFRSVGSAFHPLQDIDGFRLHKVSRQSPSFEIEGFRIEGSRFFVDEKCRTRLKESFWDDVIWEHCMTFCDVVYCAVDGDNKLRGVVSCRYCDSMLDLFLVAVHPQSHGRGLGSYLLKCVFADASRTGCSVSTSVLSSNLEALNFYLEQGFRIGGGEIVMHRWV